MDRSTLSKNAIECKDCNITFDTRPKLKYHRLKKHGKWKEDLPCEDCGKRYGSVGNLRRHQKHAHSNVKSSGSKRKCPHCDYHAQDNFHLQIHIRKHTGERPFVCQSCQFGFYKKSDLHHHSKTCRGERNKCETCGQSFHFNGQLSDHLMWSDTCGSMKGISDTGPSSASSASKLPRYMEEKPSVVRLKISRDQSVIRVLPNKEETIDVRLFQKKKRRSRCGICKACERSKDCGQCSICDMRGKSSYKKMCKMRKCLNLIDQYNLKKGENVEDALKQGTESSQIVIPSETTESFNILDNQDFHFDQNDIPDLDDLLMV